MEDYTGSVTITGLVKGTQIKITDISGNLVFETISEGGQATWDLSTYNGRRYQREYILYSVLTMRVQNRM